MKNITLALIAAPMMAMAARTVNTYNDGWEFSRDRESWSPVSVPHDWAVDSGFDAKLSADTGRLPWKGVGYYRKPLVLDEAPRGRVFLRFDGVMCDGTVYVDNQVVGHQPYGYLGMLADITPYVHSGTNRIEVRADTTKLESRWYPGAGMYRNVRLITTDRAYMPEDEVFFRVSEAGEGKSVAEVSGVVRNRCGTAADGTVLVQLLDRDGNVVAKERTEVAVRGFDDGAFAVKLEVADPVFWKMEPDAYLYTLRLVYRGAFATDTLSRKVGIRTCRLDKSEGFFLNGERVQIKGVNLHADLGPVGMAFNRSLMKRQLSVMRDMGVNAIRTSHNPPAPEVLDLCDEMGFFVWDECFDKWTATAGKGGEVLEPYIENGLVQLVKRDRNHPSVIVWSIGNEIPSGGGFDQDEDDVMGLTASECSTRERCTRFYRAVKSVDPTRPVGMGCCFKEAIENNDYADLDFTGWNYDDCYLGFRSRYPDRPIFYSQSCSAVSVAGYYADEVATNKAEYVGAPGMVDSYDRNSVVWGDIADVEFERAERDRFVAGEFVWTGVDYLGEPSPCERTGARSSYFGICDLLAFPKDRFYLYRSHWNLAAQTVHIVPGHWNFGLRSLPVYVYAGGADEVELFVNGVSQGRRRLDPKASFENSYFDSMKRYRYMWDEVVFAPGEVVAVAYDKDGRELGRDKVRTAGEAAKVVLRPENDAVPELDEAEQPFMSVVEVSLADAEGVRVPTDDRRIAFAAEGPLEIVAVGNGNPLGTDSFKKTDSHPLHMGRAGVVIRRTGPGAAKLTASAPGLESATVVFER